MRKISASHDLHKKGDMTVATGNRRKARTGIAQPPSNSAIQPTNSEITTSGVRSIPAPSQGVSGEGQPSQPRDPYDLSKSDDLIELFRKEDVDVIRLEVAAHVTKILERHGLSHYTTLMLYDNYDSLMPYHANAIYEGASAVDAVKDILLILQSSGGSVEAAYLISKTCARLTKSSFVVAVPRRAKSAATLLALGADQIHMGLMSELGPVDPQINGYPALGLINSLNVIAEIACKHPESAELLSRYLSRKLELQHLGYYVRVPESATQYAERLLHRNEGRLPKGATPHSVAEHFVKHYKDHGFVIDMDEASQLLGQIVRNETPEYRASNEIYRFLDAVERYAGLFKKKQFWYVGSIDTGMSMWRDKKN